jgi:hypothetical protein
MFLLLKGLDQEIMKDMTRRYSFIRPPNAECTLQMGGLYVLNGDKMLYAHMDKGLGDHAPNKVREWLLHIIRR